MIERRELCRHLLQLIVSPREIVLLLCALFRGLGSKAVPFGRLCEANITKNIYDTGFLHCSLDNIKEAFLIQRNNTFVQLSKESRYQYAVQSTHSSNRSCKFAFKINCPLRVLRNNHLFAFMALYPPLVTALNTCMMRTIIPPQSRYIRITQARLYPPLIRRVGFIRFSPFGKPVLCV